MQSFGKKLKNINYVERKGVYGVSFNSTKQVALVQVPNGYFLPGGGIEKNENHASCLKREFKEETGCEIDIGQFVDCVSQFTYSPKSERYYKLIGFFYFVDIKEIVCDKIEEDHELVWRDVTHIPDIMSLEYQSWIIGKAYAILNSAMGSYFR